MGISQCLRFSANDFSIFEGAEMNQILSFLRFFINFHHELVAVFIRIKLWIELFWCAVNHNSWDCICIFLSQSRFSKSKHKCQNQEGIPFKIDQLLHFTLFCYGMRFSDKSYFYQICINKSIQNLFLRAYFKDIIYILFNQFVLEKLVNWKNMMNLKLSLA